MKAMSSSHANLLALIGEGNAGIGGVKGSFGNLSDSGDSEGGPTASRLIIVANQLPIRAKKKAQMAAGDIHSWDFEWDEDSLVYQAKAGIEQPQFDNIQVLHVGSLGPDVEAAEQEAVSSDLLSRFSCLPVFMPKEVKDKFYSGFCKQTLWPLMHYLLPLSPTSSGRFDRVLWQGYLTANKIFADRVMEIINPDADFVWIHDYHLMLLPSFLRKRFNAARIGFFLHCPFPSSEVFRTFPAREAILRSLLNSDVIGFHTFDYARHFLSCCSRMLGLTYQSRRGTLGIEYYGRQIAVKICPTGIFPSRLRRGLNNWPEAIWRRGELTAQFEGRIVMVGVDDMDVFKGIELKIGAFEQMLALHPELHGKVSLVQVANPARSAAKEVQDLRAEVENLCRRINGTYGDLSVTLMERHVPLHERIALYSIADCAVVTCTRDGMNLVPYEYVACREGPQATETEAEEEAAKVGAAPRSSMLVVSEFVGCSPSLSGAIRVNPWNLEATADALYKAITLPAAERIARHEKHWRYVRQHSSAYWAASNFAELQRACKSHSALRCYGLGFGLNFRVVALDPNFKKLQTERCAEAYGRAQRRLILVDYDGTLVASSPSFPTKPSPELLATLSQLTSDPANAVYIVSGRTRANVEEIFSPVPHLGLAAEYGMYLRLVGQKEWATVVHGASENLGWKMLVLPILELYTESTDGSFIENKESAVVWHYCDADPDFGSTQAKELLDHLEGVLSNEPVEVSAGNLTVEVKPQGVSKGAAVGRVLRQLAGGPQGGEAGAPLGFVLCVGDDKSDEEMYVALEEAAREGRGGLAPEALFACTVGQKPSRAPFYLNDPSDVLEVLQALCGGTAESPKAAPPSALAGAGGKGARPSKGEVAFA